ncbi:holo-ACP synthase [Streptomyces sp. TLI_146]|uniref:holo-ACP synthase n=1 Tax=Streptomyces sp. TLI_146 TaxID=1938858 RepID=UPI000C712649|nr:holo-ACP synthase [Streptomyces sp. TLI_146]PKV83042.1 phosphopantetheinyl transferase (holo-ACP synthase) [Streptomyces sp. TLI_146]
MNSPTTACPALRISWPQHCPPRDDPRWNEWLTGTERAYAHSLARAEEHLSARKAAKEAAAQLLGWPGPPPWQDMEIRRRTDRAPVLTVRGPLARWMREQGLVTPHVSLTHARGYAAALAWYPSGGER